MSPKLRDTINAIEDPADPELEQRVERRLDSLSKPPGSLGRLEEAVRWYCRCRGAVLPPAPRKALAVFCGDHGVTQEGVSAYPAEVTAQMAANFAGGGAAINVLCRRVGIEPTIVDVGIASAVSTGLLNRKIAHGTRNFAREPAMSATERDGAIEVGIELADAFAGTGVSLAAAGEMGIGNTTAATAIGVALTGGPAEALAGPGTGLDAAGRGRKVQVVEKALTLHGLDDRDPMRTLACVGGFEIAAMTGFYLGCAARRIPAVVDGFIASAAALAAVRIAPAVRPYLAFGHNSAEPGHELLLAALDATPLLDLGMRLGEGTGAALGIGLVDAAVALYREMATFESAGISE